LPRWRAACIGGKAAGDLDEGARLVEGPILKEIAEAVGRGCELIAVGFVGVGALETLWRTLAGWRRWGDLGFKKAVWRRFAGTIALALEFALAADIAATAIAPSWQDIGQLAAIAAIRTALNLFLERDIEAARESGAAA
jgi:uncharacterized membrane protein